MEVRKSIQSLRDKMLSCSEWSYKGIDVNMPRQLEWKSSRNVEFTGNTGDLGAGNNNNLA